MQTGANKFKLVYYLIANTPLRPTKWKYNNNSSNCAS